MGPWLWLAIPAWAALGGGFVTGWPLLQHIAVALIAIELLSFLLARLSARGLTSTSYVDRKRVGAGEEIVETFRFEKRGRWPAFWVELHAYGPDAGSFDEGETGATAHFGVRADGLRTLTRRATVQHRGRYLAAAGEVRVRDPLGLFSFHAGTLRGETVTVFPRPIEPGDAADDGRSRAESRHRWGRDGADATLGDLREYVAGDAPSRIHWRSSARRGTLMVTDPEVTDSQTTWLLVDLSGGPVWSEAAAGVAVRMLERARRSGRKVGAIVAGDELRVLPPRREGRHVAHILEALATIDGETASQMDRLIRAARTCEGTASIEVVSPHGLSAQQMRRLRTISTFVRTVPVAAHSPAVPTPPAPAERPWFVLPARVGALFLTAGLMLLSAHAATPVLGVGNEREIALVSLIGIALAAMGAGWPRVRRLPALAVPGSALTGLAVAPFHGVGVHLSVANVSVALAALLVSLACAWLVIGEHQAWPVAALAGSALIVRADMTHVYEARFPWFLIAVLLLAACLGIARTWRPGPALAAIALGSVCIGLSWHLPTASAWSSRFLDPLHQTSLSLPGLRTISAPEVDLTRPFKPSNRIVMRVRTNRPDLITYWQANVFDRYDGHAWTAPSGIVRDVPDNAGIEPFYASRGNLVTTYVRVAEATSSLIAPGSIVRSSVSSTVLYSGGDVFSVQARHALAAGQAYTTVGMISPDSIIAPSPADLQVSAGQSATRKLAIRLTEMQSSDLGRVDALVSYLRQSGRFRYDISAASPASDDAVADFLFRSHRGFCNQFASALVVMARDAGVPARFVTGYITGTPSHGTYVVRERDAHAWAQVFIQGTGWVSVDATPGARIVLGDHISSGGSSSTGPRRHVVPPRAKLPVGWRRGIPPVTRTTQAAPTEKHDAGSPLPWLGGTLFILFGILAAGYALRPRSLSQYYASAVRAAPRGRFESWMTPLEYADAFRDEAEFEPVHLIANMYTQQRYAGHPVSDDDLRRVRRAWLTLRRRWLLRRILP